MELGFSMAAFTFGLIGFVMSTSLMAEIDKLKKRIAKLEKKGRAKK